MFRFSELFASLGSEIFLSRGKIGFNRSKCRVRSEVPTSRWAEKFSINQVIDFVTDRVFRMLLWDSNSHARAAFVILFAPGRKVLAQGANIYLRNLNAIPCECDLNWLDIGERRNEVLTTLGHC